VSFEECQLVDECNFLKENRVIPRNSKTRQRVISWLDENGIAWKPCGSRASDKYLLCGYLGEIYIDLPFDTANAEYQKLADYLETPDGQPKNEGVIFCYLPLEAAMKNKHHDEPGYWDKREEECWGGGDGDPA
jgi:hypothetical protein